VPSGSARRGRGTSAPAAQVLPVAPPVPGLPVACFTPGPPADCPVYPLSAIRRPGPGPQRPRFRKFTRLAQLVLSGVLRLVVQLYQALALREGNNTKLPGVRYIHGAEEQATPAGAHDGAFVPCRAWRSKPGEGWARCPLVVWKCTHTQSKNTAWPRARRRGPRWVSALGTLQVPTGLGQGAPGHRTKVSPEPRPVRSPASCHGPAPAQVAGGRLDRLHIRVHLWWVSRCGFVGCWS
jgi:hypothetical protein